MKNRWIAILLVLIMTFSLCSCGGHEKGTDEQINKMIEGMTTEQKLAQMMVVAFRSDSHNTKTATEISPAYEELLKKYGFGGIIMFGGNIEDAEQTVKMIRDCQTAAMASEQGVPLLVCADQEGGLVNRVSFGVTGSGSMALAATGDTKLAEECADMLGQEIAALGFNMNFAPVSDVNNNPNNPVIGIRAFSDDPETVAKYVPAFLNGLSKNKISSALKHFPGHGNVGEDSHTGLPSSELTIDELKECELVPFQAGIDAGADMIMTAHIQYPNIEKETYKSRKDGKTVNLPATLSHAIINGLLRETMGYDGIVITDAMDMDAIAEHFNPIDAAVMSINAGVDILLCPVDLYQDDETDTFPKMEKYMKRLVKKVESGDIKEEELDDSVARILKLKYEKGIMKDTLADSEEDQLDRVKEVVGSEKHLTRDWEITQKSMTLLKNSTGMLPLDGNSGKHTVILATNEYRMPTVEYALERLEKEGLLDASTVTTINYDGMQFNDDGLQKALKDADQLIILSQSADRNDLVDRAIWRVHQNEGGKALLLSLNLPYDAATYKDADAILCAYHPYGSAHDADGNGPFNMNLAVALCTVYGQSVPQGKLPVNVPKVDIAEDGTATFLDEVLYERGSGLKNWK
ncbi:MAG: hypothetical protein IJJ06_01965 [Mogibacterium sp.]|nr:hypothetical protein [Mogibacterium sp.]